MYITRLLFVKTGIIQVYNPKSNSTSFMFNNIFCETKSKKVIHWWGPGGNWGPVLISSWRCNFSIYVDIQEYYLDIKAITTLLCLILLSMCWLLLFIHFSTLQLLSWKVRFTALKRIRIPEFWTYKDGTRFILKRNEVSIRKYL